MKHAPIAYGADCIEVALSKWIKYIFGLVKCKGRSEMINHAGCRRKSNRRRRRRSNMKNEKWENRITKGKEPEKRRF